MISIWEHFSQVFGKTSHGLLQVIVKFTCTTFSASCTTQTKCLFWRQRDDIVNHKAVVYRIDSKERRGLIIKGLMTNLFALTNYLVHFSVKMDLSNLVPEEDYCTKVVGV